MSDQSSRRTDEIDQKLREIEWQIERDEEEQIRREEEDRNELDHRIYRTRKEKKGESSWPLAVKKVIKYGKLCLFVICGIGIVKAGLIFGSWIVGGLMVGGIAFLGYKIFIDD